ncbi:MAG: exosortase/archaeosortase family protein [Leptolyngbyaceae cyanobacterium SL_7_1]|nr:exosortase/archaeosortase family protein [Leptolyngbyaceae cyanobacterium SL_7_1]
MARPNPPIRWCRGYFVAIAIYTPILRGLVGNWIENEDYSHGFLIVPLSLYFLWERREKLAELPAEGSWWGLLPLLLASVTLFIGRLGVEYMNQRLSFVLLVNGLVLLLLGRQIYKAMAFPCSSSSSWCRSPSPSLNTIAFPLQLIAAGMAVSALHLVGVPALLEGNIIHLANGPLFVAEACSGLRSLMALITLGVVFAYFFRRNLGERIVIVLSTIPIAIVVNSFRVALTGVLAHHFGPDAAGGVVHETQGLFTFAIAFLLLLLEAWLLSKIWPRLFGGEEEATA